MKNTRPQNRLHGFFLAFLIVVLAFAAVGFGTLGSVTPVGKAYELRAERTDDEGDETPGVAFRLTNPMEGDKALPMRVCAVYINIAAIYAEAGTGVTLKLQRSSSGTYYYDVGNKVTVENFTSQAGTAQDVVDPFFNYVAPFDFSSVTWKVDTYHIAKLFLDGKDGANVLLNEVVFVGEVLDEDEEGTGKYRVIPATIESATPYATESAEEAKARAAALLDAQYMPSDAQSTFFRYTRDEAYTLMTIAEMGRGSVYAADRNGVPIDTYTAEGVYGVFGTDIVALGTLIFGMSPFGARFFSMLAAVLTLVLLSRLLVRLTKSEKAGLVFAVLYAASCLTLGYGHMATPLMVGIFFFALSLWLTYGFYEAKGLRRASVVSVLPLLFAGLAGGAAICVQGAFVIPMLGVVGLFIAGMVRQNREKSRLLAEIIEEAETGTESASGEEEPESPGLRAGRLLSEYRFKNTAAPVFFAAGLVAGAFLLMVLGMLPAYFVYLKVYDSPVAGEVTANIFSLAWQTFVNGFAGQNAFAAGSARSVFRVVFRGTGEVFGMTAIAFHPVALLAGAAGIALSVFRLFFLIMKKEKSEEEKEGLLRSIILLAGFVLSIITAFAVKSGDVFFLLADLFWFLLAADLFGGTYEGKAGTAVKVLNIVGIVLTVLGFAALAVFTFSIPLPAAFFQAVVPFLG